MSSNVARRGSGYRARYRDDQGKEHSKQFTRKVDAQRWLDDITTAVGTGRYVDPSRSQMTVGDLADQWLAGKINLKVPPAPGTRRY